MVGPQAKRKRKEEQSLSLFPQRLARKAMLGTQRGDRQADRKARRELKLETNPAGPWSGTSSL